MNIDLNLTQPQRDFVLSTAKYPAFVGGFGAGKSESLVNRLLLQALQNPQGQVGYFAPTFDLIRLIAWPRFLAKCDEWGLRATLNKTENILTLKRGGRIVFRTLDTPERIVGFEICHAGIDELDTLKEEHALAAWRAVNARVRMKTRDGSPNTVSVGTTPEGFKLVYKLWEQNPKAGFQLYRAPTSSNPFLPADYVAQLMTQYPPHLLQAYLEGLFVNLASGSVYPAFSRVLNYTDATVTTVQNHHGMLLGQPEALHIGMDFNKGNGAAAIAVIRDGLPLIVGEECKTRDTPEMIERLQTRFPGHHITVYPDASGRHGNSTNASESDLSLLRAAGFTVCTRNANPRVVDRVTSLNAMILNAEGQRRLLVNTAACPEITLCLEQQVYDKAGAPDKSGGKDHMNDAVGYLIHFLWPVVKPVATRETQIIHVGR